MTWNLSAKICLTKSNDTLLLEVFNKEIKRWNRFLFNLLSITYDSGSITKIKENLEKETVESVNYALEMIDIVIEDSVKPKLIALLDVASDEEKLKNLHQFFPGEIPQYSSLLENLINRDYNVISLWTKAYTLRNLPEIEGDNLAESVVALLFSPEGIIQEESAKLIARSSRELYKSATQRIPRLTKNRLDKIVNGEAEDMGLLFEKVKFLSGTFPGIPEDDLLTMASDMKYEKYMGNGFNLFPPRCIIWPLPDERSEGSTVLIHYADQEKSSAEKIKISEGGALYFLSLDSVEEFHYQYPDKSFEILKYIDNNEE
jgi:hypothetical protein